MLCVHIQFSVFFHKIWKNVDKNLYENQKMPKISKPNPNKHNVLIYIYEVKNFIKAKKQSRKQLKNQDER